MKLFHKILVFSIFIVISSSGLTSIWGTLFIKREYEQRMKNILSFTAENVSDAVERYIESTTRVVLASVKKYENLPDSERILVFGEIMRDFKDVLFLSDGKIYVGDIQTIKLQDLKAKSGTIFQDKKIVIYSDGITIVMSKEPIDRIIAGFSIGQSGQIEIEQNLEGLSGIIPVDSKGIKAFRKIGNSNMYVSIFLPQSEIEGIWKKISSQVLFFFISSVVLSLILSFIFTRSITKPLSKIENLARKYSKLDFSEKVISSRKDEVGEVIRAFHSMISEIEKSWEELKRWNLELEKRVEERTAQLKKMHDNLLVAEKMASVGTLGAGVAHEINNPLASSIGFLQIAKIKTQDENAKKYIEKVLPNLERIKQIVSRMSYFAEVQMKAEYSQVELKKILSEIINHFEDKGKVFEKELYDTSYIYADEEQIRTALYEVIKNAFLASESKIKVKLYQKEKTIFIEVKDDGEEIPKEYIKRIFDPFFTLKKWEGIGLGLTIAKTVFNNLKGDIYVSEDDRKTFIIEIDAEKNKEIKEFLKEEEEKIKAHLV
ncbi:Sporulation kinase A [bacterium HR19]|nr:Sporulation kinase A [bacterium HR19]